MAKIEQQNAELMDDDEFQIVDLEPPASPRQKQVARVSKLILTGLKTPWIRYGLSGILVFILLGALILQWPRPAPASQSNPVYTPPTFLNATFARDLTFIQTTDHVLTAFQLATGRRLWHVRLPAVARIDASDQAHLYCFFTTSNNATEMATLDINTGKLIWHDALPAAEAAILYQPGIFSTYQTYNSSRFQAPYFIYHEGTLYFQTSHNMLYAIQASNGQVKWTYQAQTSTQASAQGSSAPVVTFYFPMLEIQGNIITFQTEDTFVHVLDRSTGQQIFSTPPLQNGSPVYPYVDGQTIYFLPPPSISPIRAFHIPDGRLLWTHPLPKDTWAQDEVNGVVYLGAAEGSTLIALRGSDGQQIWSYHASDGQALISDVGEEPGIVDLLQHDATLLRVRVSDGQILWRTHIAALKNTISQSAALLLQNDTLLLYDANDTTSGITTTMPFYIFSTNTGHLLWHSSMPSGPCLFLADTLYSIQANGQIDAWRNSDGLHLWSYRAPINSTIFSPSDMTSPQLFIRDLSGKFYVLRASDGKQLWHNP